MFDVAVGSLASKHSNVLVFILLLSLGLPNNFHKQSLCHAALSDGTYYYYAGVLLVWWESVGGKKAFCNPTIKTQTL